MRPITTRDVIVGIVGLAAFLAAWTMSLRVLSLPLGGSLW